MKILLSGLLIKKPIPLNDSDHVNGSMSQFAIASSMSSLEAIRIFSTKQRTENGS